MLHRETSKHPEDFPMAVNNQRCGGVKWPEEESVRLVQDLSQMFHNI